MRCAALFALFTTVAASAFAADTAASASTATLAEVQAILNQRCTSCHGETKPKGKVKLTDAAGIAKVVTAGDPSKSKLYTLIVLPDGDDDRMPPAKGGKHERVPDAEAEKIRQWIAAGAK